MAWHPQIVKTTGSPVVDPEPDFLASEHFTAKRVGMTIDYSTVPADSNGRRTLTKGTVMGEITATGKYGPYDNGASDGREIAKGFLQESIEVTNGDAVAGLIISGSVIAERCSGLDTAGVGDLTNFTFQ